MGPRRLRYVLAGTNGHAVSCRHPIRRTNPFCRRTPVVLARLDARCPRVGVTRGSRRFQPGHSEIMDISSHDLLQFAQELRENPVKRRASHFSFARALAAVLLALTTIVCSAAAQGISGISISVQGGAGVPVQGV